MLKATLTAIAFAIAVIAHSADALEFRQQPSPPDPLHVVVWAEGSVNAGDAHRFSQFLGDLPRNHVVEAISLDSPGGLIVEAADIAEIIHNINAPTIIQSQRQCVSACFLMFAAGAHRVANATAHIGIHSVSVEHGKENLETLGATTAMAREAYKYNVPSAILGKMITTPPNQINWLERSDLKAMGVAIIDAPVADASHANKRG
jgi:hypothetical protein